MDENNNDYKNWEFKLVDSDIQKILNQWRHEYFIKILQLTSCNGIPIALIVRRKING
jgi:hypothetical protein